MAPGHYWTSQTAPDLKLSRHLRNFGPAPHSPAAPRAARRARSSGPTLVLTPQPRRTHAGSTRWRVFSLLKFMFGDQQWATCNSGPRLGITSRRHSCSRGRTTSVRGRGLAPEPEPQFNAGASVHVTRGAYSEICSMTPPPQHSEQGNGLVKY